MSDVIENLPEGVSMCEYFKEKVEKRREGKRKFRYIRVTYDGRSFYVPITRSVWEAFGLKDMIDENGDGTHGVNFKVEEALREIVGAIQQQVGDDVLCGIEESVIRHVNEKMAGMMHEPLMKELERMADQKMPLMIEEKKL